MSMLIPIAVPVSFLAIFILTVQFFPVRLFAMRFADNRAQGFVPKVRPLLRMLAKPLSRIKQLEGIRHTLARELAAAGQPHDLLEDEFIALQLVSFAGVMTVCILLPYGLLSVRVLLGAAGIWLPRIWLKDLRQERRKKIVRALPGFIDLLTLAVEAGMDFMAALKYVVQMSTRDVLVDEFRQVLDRIRFGTSREDALRTVIERNDIQELSSFVQALIQASKLGTPLGSVLRIQAEEMRRRRLLRAEKLGQEASVKIILPLVVFIFPCVMIILLGALFINMRSGGL